MHTASKRRTDYRSVPSAGTEETYREFHAQSADALDTRIDMDKYFVSGGLDVYKRQVYHDLYFVAGGDVHLHEEQAAFGELLFCYVPYFVCVHSVPLLFRPCV